MRLNHENNLYQEISTKQLEEKDRRIMELEKQVNQLTEALIEEKKRYEACKVINDFVTRYTVNILI